LPLFTNVEKFGRARQDKDGNIKQRMRSACWTTTATDTNTHSQHVILTAFPRQQWSCERASMFRYTYVACILQFTLDKRVSTVHQAACHKHVQRNKDIASGILNLCARWGRILPPRKEWPVGTDKRLDGLVWTILRAGTFQPLPETEARILRCLSRYPVTTLTELSRLLIVK
jgi:hypothetical protein